MITIDWVTVGDPGNTADNTSYGAVVDSFRIMKFEFQNSQYAAFLNAVDPTGTNPNSVYNANMGSDARGGISFTSGAASGSKYAIRTNMGDKPVNYVSWFDAARVANWLQNGQGAGSTEMGAYTLNGATTGNAVAVNPGASYFLPTEDQWYKAAYYKGGSATAGYWDYATQTATIPTAVTADVTGIGSAGIGSTANLANYKNEADWNSLNGNLTTVGTSGRPSAYGAFDLNGNVWEWNDGGGTAGNRVLRGGSFVSHDAVLLKSTFRSADRAPGDEDADIGFRLASTDAAPIPEPGTWAAMAIFAGGAAYAGWRRRRQHAL